MTDFKDKQPRLSPFNAYGVDCPCGGWMNRTDIAAGIWECDGLDEKHQWMRNPGGGWRLVKSIEVAVGYTDAF